MQKINHIIKSFGLVALLMAGTAFVACTSDDIMTEEQQQPTAAKMRTLTIQTTKGEDATTRVLSLDESGDNDVLNATWKAGEKVYVYKTGGRGSLDRKQIGVLTAQTSGANTTLFGEIDVTDLNQNTDLDQSFNFDELTLEYEGHLGEPSNIFTIVDNTPRQNGTLQTISDYYDKASASVYVLHINDKMVTATSADFTNNTAIVRFTLKDAETNEILNPSSFCVVQEDDNIVASNNNALAPFYATNGDGNIFIALNNYYSIGLNITALVGSDTYFFSKDDTGFSSGKYYEITVNMTKQEKVKPAIIWDETKDYAAVEPDENGHYMVYGPADGDGFNPATFTITGISKGYNFFPESGATITLDKLTAISTANSPFIGCDNGDLNIVVNGTVNISSNHYFASILSNGSNAVKLSGEGTLTVSGWRRDDCGIVGSNYYSGDLKSMEPGNNRSEETGEVDVTDLLAAPGFTVVRSARVDGPISDPEEGPDYYTWTYTISQKTLAQATTADVGKIVGADGRIYNDFDDIFSAGIPARAMVAFVGAVDGVCEHGLAISLMDAYNYQTTWSGAQDVAISEWVATYPVVGGTWRLPSFKDWQYMLWGYYVESPEETDISGFNTKLDNAGGYKLADGSDAYFWTSTSVDDDNAKLLYYDGSQWSSFSDSSKDGYWHIRACLAF